MKVKFILIEIYIAGRRKLERHRVFICFALLSGGCECSRRARLTAVIKIFSSSYFINNCLRDKR